MNTYIWFAENVSYQLDSRLAFKDMYDSYRHSCSSSERLPESRVAFSRTLKLILKDAIEKGRVRYTRKPAIFIDGLGFKEQTVFNAQRDQ